MNDPHMVLACPHLCSYFHVHTYVHTSVHPHLVLRQVGEGGGEQRDDVFPHKCLVVGVGGDRLGGEVPQRLLDQSLCVYTYVSGEEGRG